MRSFGVVAADREQSLRTISGRDSSAGCHIGRSMIRLSLGSVEVEKDVRPAAAADSGPGGSEDVEWRWMIFLRRHATHTTAIMMERMTINDPITMAIKIMIISRLDIRLLSTRISVLLSS